METDIKKIRQDFPILQEKIYDKDLVYLDNAATTQKPDIVINTISEYYRKYNSNVHRGIHYLSNFSTTAYENTRETIHKFINSKYKEEIIFTKGTTESINLVAFSFGEAFVKEGDEIIVSEMEHHSNIVPWQLLAERKKCKIKVLPFDDSGELIISELENLITEKTKIIAVTQVSNVLGTVNPVKKIIEIAHSKNVSVLIDGAQGIQHTFVDVQKMDCDFYVFSAHKIYGPTGVGVLYGKKEILEKMPPYQSGGEMISKVTFEKTTFNELPYKFEAGTPNYIDVIAFEKAIHYVNDIGIHNIKKYEDKLLEYATEQILKIDGIKIIGEAKHKSSVLSFTVNDIHPADIGTILDKMGIAIRTGTHCAETAMQHFKINGTARASFAFYNTLEEIDKFIISLEKSIMMLR
ncbi:MAG: cysteine desulfurase [Bacteroidales bacterium]|jgi:cysteine desulfurase/selenocysteine lyase|nr:cysteine desulfurase [Bacteroidales bacterium]